MIKELMTPKELLSKDDFDTPQVISPDNCWDFDSLLCLREDIRNLRILPIKLDAARVEYRQRKNEIAGELFEMMGSKQVMFMHNQYPYFLPSDVQQSIIWIAEGVDEAVIVEYIAEQTKRLQIGPAELILFERPRQSKKLMVKGTFPALRHIHFWTRK